MKSFADSKHVYNNKEYINNVWTVSVGLTNSSQENFKQSINTFGLCRGFS